MMKRYISGVFSRNYSSIKNFSHYTDAFGNNIFRQNTAIKSQLNAVDLKNIVSSTPKTKAILLVGADRAVIDKYNFKAEFDIKAKFQCQTNGDDVYLIRNNSASPELCIVDNKPQFMAGGVSVIIRYDNKLYALVVKDRSKRYLTCPGGTGTNADMTNIVDNNEIGRRIAVRELYEETRHTNIPGIQLQHYNISTIARFHFKTSFFDVGKFDDTYWFNSIYYNAKYDSSSSNSMNQYCQLLFSDSNKIEGGYKLNYTDHPETEYIYAVRIPFSNNNQIIRDNHHSVTNLHLDFINFNIGTLRQSVCENYQTINPSDNHPTNLQSVDVDSNLITFNKIY